MTSPSRVLGFLAVAVVTGGFGQRAAAQLPGGQPAGPPIMSPAYSPYLNLVQRGGNARAAVNYYGIVRPQLEFRGAIQGLQMQAARNQQALSVQQQVDPETGLPVTGHGAYFLNTGGYFMRLGAAGPGASRAGTPTFGQAGRGTMPGTAPVPARRR